MRDGDIISLDAKAGTIELQVSDEELAERRKLWKPRDHAFGSGAIWRYAQTVGSALNGAVTHPGQKGETHVYADV